MNNSAITSSLQERIIEDIELKDELIHRGTYSKVVEAKWEGLVVAVKQIHDVYEKELEISEYFHLHQLSHANIVRFFGIYFPSTMKLPSLVMERLDCSLCDLLEQNVSVPMRLSILHQTGLGIRYLHSRVPTIVHGKLSTKKVLISKGMEAKIMYRGTIVNIKHNDSKSTEKCFEMDFMAPERFTSTNRTHGKEVDVFSFGCIILHTFLSTKPSYNVGKSVIHLLTTLKRNTQHLDKATGDVVIQLIQNCLKHLPLGRPSVVEVCDQLEALLLKANRKDLPSNLLQALLMLEAAAKPCYITPSPDQASSEVWMKLKLTWQQCSNLPVKCWVTSVVTLDGNVYVVANHGTKLPISFFYVYDPNNDKWSLLPNPPYRGFSLAAVPGKKQLLAIGGVSLHNTASSNVFLWDELNKKWITTYPNMPTSRCYCSCISYGSAAVIVAGGVTGSSSVLLTLTTAVEVLHIDNRNSYWSVVQCLPIATFEAIPLIIDERLYIAVGHGEDGKSKRKIVTASIPALLQSSKYNNTDEIWSKLPDLPYSSPSISHHQGHLITFSGDHLIEQTDNDNLVWESVSEIHLYNPDAKVWDYVGEVPYNYTSGMSAQLSSNKILFIAGLTGTHVTSNIADLVTTCWTLTITPKHPSIIPY